MPEKKQCHRARHFNLLYYLQSSREPETLAAASTNIRLLHKERRPRVFERHPCWVNKGKRTERSYTAQAVLKETDGIIGK